ncbi:PREDICTED: endoglucanase 5 [Tarenaya hassleriana]|uniref:endoglucanase 5 n=1 Tax=Tarenaya hassleriana TaxID=28532 RepID=UPI00053C45A0|nr:PREDICTED: endoglucanase 5 [Tarenaya hassleriana]
MGGGVRVRTLEVAILVVAFASASATAFAYNNYGEALDKTFMFFEAQRSGKLPASQRVKWRGDSALKDGLSQGVNLVGGYYDAGDHVKFGLPMAFTVTMLSWAAVDFRRELVGSNQMQQTLTSIRWGTDYFLRAHPQENLLWAQVGDGESDHYCWERAEDMTTSRTSYKLDEYSPGSDLAGETAASLAAASLAFKPFDSSYSDLLLLHAKQLFQFADKYRGLYTDSIPNAKAFYMSSGYSDELLWASTWLYRATGDQYYLKYVVENAGYMGGTGWAMKEFSWDNKYAGVQILLTKILLDGKGGEYTPVLKQYQTKADYFACACLEKNGGYNIQKTPGGLMYVREWNNMQYVSAAAFLLAVYSDYLSAANAKLNCPDGSFSPQLLLDFAKSQADYILGMNPRGMSYLVGYGPKYPYQVHHRGASITSIFLLRSSVSCVQGFDSWYRRPQANPNIIHGALVGGPDQNDNFDDDRSNYEQTEPTLSGTAPLVGLFAKLSGKLGSYGRTPSSSSPPYQSTKTPSQESPVSYQKTTPSSYTAKPTGASVEFLHSITNTWMDKNTRYYRHKVIVKNTSRVPITGLQLLIRDLEGPIWGLNPTSGEKNVYELPPWVKQLGPGQTYTFVYVQGGPQAKVSVLSYH